MIGLGDFILYYNIQNDDPMYHHLCIEFDNFLKLNESKGVPDGLRDDSSYIGNLIYDELQKANRNFSVKIQLSKLKLTGVFDSLEINVIIDNSIENNGSTNFKKDFDQNFIITLFLNKDISLIDIIKSIGHELLHCVTYVKNSTKYYDANIHNIKSFFLRRLSKFSYDKLDNDIKNYEDYLIKQIIYYTNNDEVNAFITELTLELENNHPSNADEAYKMLYNNDKYIFYNNIRSLLKSSELSNEQKHLMCNIYRTLVISDKSYSDKQVMNKLDKRLREIKKRLIKVIPRLCYEHSCVVLSSDRHTASVFFETFKKIYKN